MKNLFVAICATFLIVSCSSDDDASASENNAVEGNYRLVSFESESSFDLDGNGTMSNDLLEETGCYQNETITFFSDNTGVGTSRSFADISVEVEVVNGEETTTQIVECIMETTISDFAWAQSGDQVTIVFEGASVTATVSSNNELVFVIPSGFVGEVESDTEGSVTLIEDVTVTYERI